MDPAPPTRDILTNPPAFPPSPATTTLLTNPPTTPIQTIQTFETPERTLTGLRVTWTNGDSASLGVCEGGSGPSPSTEPELELEPETNPSNTTTNKNNKTQNPITKTFTFDRQERIQIMYIYVGSTQVDGFWFVTNKQKSFFPGRSSERREMSELGSGVLVGIEGRERLDELGRVVGVLGLGVSFRR